MVTRFCASRRVLESLPIIAVNVKDSLARIAPSETAIGRPTATARRLVDASVSRFQVYGSDAGDTRIEPCGG